MVENNEDAQGLANMTHLLENEVSPDYREGPQPSMDSSNFRSSNSHVLQAPTEQRPTDKAEDPPTEVAPKRRPRGRPRVIAARSENIAEVNNLHRYTG
jgi:hypothetical protein